jgi:hypothetical protein
MAGKTYIKTSATTWAKIKKIYLKTGGQTWTAVRKAYIKTGTGTWRKVYDTASNKPFLKNNDFPRIRLNSFRSAGYIEAPPVQMMGPSTGSANGWPLGAIGTYLYGANADDLSNYVSGNGSNITYTYNWYRNFSGNQNDDSEWTGAVNSGGTGIERDLFQNNSTYLGQSDGNTFDRNFITFKVNATNSAGTLSASSPQLYIVRQRPSGTVTMIDAETAAINSTMSATFTYSNFWYNKTDLAESYVEWFAVDNLSDTLTTSNRVQIEYLNTFSTTGTTTRSATTFYVPTISNKFYIVRTTLNNSSTLPAKYAGSVINVSGFIPKSAFTATANKTSKTVASNGPFNLTNATKTSYYYDTPSATWRRFVSVNIGQSSSADRYEVQIEGQYSGTSGTYNFSSASWVVVQSFFQSPYAMETSRIGGILTQTASVLNYLNYRVTARSLNGTTTNGAAYSNGGTQTSLQYITVPALAPSAPSISNIQTATDSFGSFITFNNVQSSNGSNDISYYTYSINNGSTFQQTSGFSFITSTSGKIYLTAGSTVNLRIRATNLDEETSSSSNLLSITVATQPGVPSSVVVRSFTDRQGTIFFTSGSNTQSVLGAFEYDGFSTFDYIEGFTNISSNSAGKIQITGGNSSVQTYTPALLPYSGTNKTGNTGALTNYSGKVLNGSDRMQITLGTPTLSGSRTINVSWTLASGLPTHYVARLYQFSNGSIISTKTITSSTTSVSFTSSDGVNFSTQYYIGIQPQYQYTSSVTYEDTNYVSSNVITGADLSAPTPTGVTYTSDGRFNISFTGGSGPYYQLYWASATGAIAGSLFASYDAASTDSPIKELPMASNGSTYYFWVRSSNENLGNTTSGGIATSGTYSAWSSTNVSITAAQPSGGTASISGGTTAGSTLTLSVTDASGTPSPLRSIIWRRADGGTGGNSFTGGSVMQTGGTTYVIDSTIVGFSSAGYQIRAEVTWANGVGFNQIVNTNAITVTTPVKPSGTKRIIPLGITVTSGSTIAYVSTNGFIGLNSDPSTSIGIPSSGRYLNILQADLRQTALFTKATSTTYAIRYQGHQLGDVNQTVDYEILFTFGSTSAQVFIITNNLSTAPSNNVLIVNGTANNTWSGTNTSTMSATADTSNTTQNGIDDARTAITLTAPVTSTAPTGGSVSVNPTTGTAGSTAYTASASGWTGSGTISYTYSWQRFNNFSFSYQEIATGTTFSPTVSDNSIALAWALFVTASNGTLPNGTAATSFTVNNPAAGSAPGIPSSVGLTGSGSVSWTAPTGSPTSYEIEFFTAQNGSGLNAAGAYLVTGISGTSYQLTSPYASPNNWARVRVRARNASGASDYSGWVPSASTYT